MFDYLLDFMFPQTECCLCGCPGNYWTRAPWCAECEGHLREVRRGLPICRQCGKYLEGEADDLCQACAKKKPPFEMARSVAPYEGSAKKAIKVYKFLEKRNLAPKMADMMAEVIRENPDYFPIDLVIAVPVSADGMRKRGFNQSELLAERIATLVRARYRYGVLNRIASGPPQRELTREEREKNPHGSFIVQDNYVVRGKNILLVDDVYTTGATVRECATVLLKAEAKRVNVITWASGKGY